MGNAIFERKTLTSHIVLYKNRLEFKYTGPFAKTEVILLRTVTSIETGIARNMTITTNDSKKHTIPIFGAEAETLKAHILANL